MADDLVARLRAARSRSQTMQVRTYEDGHEELFDPLSLEAADALAEQAETIQRLRHEFKNFHRLLCERFGYGHDEVDWQRDQLSLIEWIAKRPAVETKDDPDNPKKREALKARGCTCGASEHYKAGAGHHENCPLYTDAPPHPTWITEGD